MCVLAARVANDAGGYAGPGTTDPYNRRALSMLAYKFRSPSQLELALDVIFERRLYCADWKQLNDPMEGVFRHTYCDDAEFNERIDTVLRERSALRVCALSSNGRSPLMWSHYAAGHTGFALEIEIPEECAEVCRVSYNGDCPLIEPSLASSPSEIARTLLGWKHLEWKYESEVRILQRDEFFAPVAVKRVLVGCRMKPALYQALQVICRSQEIDVVDMLP